MFARGEAAQRRNPGNATRNTPEPREGRHTAKGLSPLTGLRSISPTFPRVCSLRSLHPGLTSDAPPGLKDNGRYTNFATPGIDTGGWMSFVFQSYAGIVSSDFAPNTPLNKSSFESIAIFQVIS